jgi:serine/threonine protein kinase/tetratricopeptide (TPR) repeat protein
VDQDRSEGHETRGLGSGRESQQPDVGSRIRKANVKAALFKKPTPMRIGRFILLERIGAGAMGEVYAAYDEQLDRKVALKLVRSAVRDSTRAHERLLREAQTLAQLSHPNVVQVYEAGTHEGSVFIAMEFIHGQTLAAWLETTREQPRKQRQREILRQFVAAGRGLEASHRAGLAHRDFKPDNVLVGDDGRVRVVDFGLARAVADITPTPDAPRRETRAGTQPPNAGDGTPVVTSELTLDMEVPQPAPSGEKLTTSEITEMDPPVPEPPVVPWDDVSTSASMQRKAALRLTATGTVMGTPRYMAPEQMRGQTADHRSDQFSFCVSLFHALYDEWPFQGGNVFELMRAAANGNIVLPKHQTEVPAPIRKALLRGLSAKPAERFPDMGELLRVLEGWAQRRRRSIWGLGATALVAGSVAAFAAVAQRPEPCAGITHEIDALWTPAHKSAFANAFHSSGIPFAGAAWRSTETLLDEYVTTWRRGAKDACEATHVHQRQSAQLLDRRMLCLDRGKQRLDALLASIGGGAAPLSQAVVEHVFEVATALPDLAVCNDTRSLLLAVEPPAQPELAQEVARIRERLAEARTHELLGRYDEALRVAEEQHRTAEALPYPPLRAEALFHVGLALAARGTSGYAAQAEVMYLDAIDIAESVHHDQLAAEIWHRLVLLAHEYDPSMARGHAWSRREQAAVRRIGDPAQARAEALHAGGMLHWKDGDHAAAIERYRQAITLLEAVQPQSPLLASYYHDWANGEYGRGDYVVARTLFERALGMAIDQRGPVHPKVARLQRDFARLLLDFEELDRARALLQTALTTWQQVHHGAHLHAGLSHLTLSEVEAHAGNFYQARAHMQEGRRILDHALPPDHGHRAEPHKYLGIIELRQGNFEAASQAFEDALVIQRRHLGDKHVATGWTRYYLAESLVGLERYDDALAQCDMAQAVTAEGAAMPVDFRAMLLGVRGRALLGGGHAELAVEALEQAAALFRENQGLPWERAATLWALARALQLSGEHTHMRPLELAREARAIYAARGPAAVRTQFAITAWLHEHGAR